MIKNINIGKACLLTLAPSFMMTIVYYICGNITQAIPSLLLFFLVAICTLFPFEIFFIVKNKEVYKDCFKKNKLWKIILWAVGLFGYAGIVSVSIANLENLIFGKIAATWNSLFSSYFNWNNYEIIRGTYSRNILIVTVIMYFILNVVVCPIIEEFYFRGFLTARMEKYGWKAPIIVMILFSLYHFWLPFQNFFRIFIFIPVALVVYRKKNITISMLFHCMCNLLSAISFMIAVLY